jgi:hypothetical protein
MTTEIKVEPKKWQNAAEMVRIGVFTINEVRAFLGLPSIGSQGDLLAS